ncbi:MAG: cysteine desulfurase family protein [Candidatus Parcubacteria bacterium]|nr:cysteine desulfurase family protein [Candidatus Parcubacteria bacterium]
MLKRVYLDYAATSPADERVIKAMEPYWRHFFGNPSSLHSFGQETRGAVEAAREKVAHLIGAEIEEIVFTSGGTEADNFALKGVAYAAKSPGNHLITTQIEHSAILNPAKFLSREACLPDRQGFEVTYLSPQKDGLIKPEDLRAALTDKTILISIMHANNEVGTIEPIKELAEVIQKFRGAKKFPLFHVDAVQTVGHLPVNVNELGVDLLSISAHKLYGPKGVGALYIRKGITLEPFMHGGEQERGRRGSTENVAGIVGFGKACELAEKEMDAEKIRLTKLRDYFIQEVTSKIDRVTLNGHATRRLPNNINLSFEGIEGESMMLSLDLAGIACSTGSACSSNTLEPSHVMLALGVNPEMAHSSLRFTLGKETTKQDLDYTANQLVEIIKRLRDISPYKA